MAILNNSNAISSGVAGYDINNSLRLRSSASAYLSRTPSSTGSRTTFTYSAWVKTSVMQFNSTIFSAVNAALSGACFIRVHGDGGVDFGQYNTGADFAINTVALCRDPAAWYHIVLAVDTTQATSANRLKIYINGVQQTLTGTYPTQNQVLLVNDTKPHYVGKFSSTIDQYFDGYLAEVNFINASQLTPSDFGETDTDTGSWKPKAYTGTYGTNGFYFKFSDIAQTVSSNVGLGKDFSGNANYFVTNNISTTAGTTYDAMTDSPTLTSATVANYCVLSPLAGDLTPTNGNLSVSGVDKSTLGTVGVSSGKWYFEMTCVSNVATTNNDGVGIGNCGINNSAPDKAFYIYRSSGVKLLNGGSNTSYGASFTTGDVIGVAYDADAGTLVFYKNNSSQGTAFTGITGTMLPIVYARGITSTPTLALNFGQQPFIYTPPTGFNRLNTYNLPDSTVKAGNKYMDATLWTGNSTSGRAITNAQAFKPDFVWIKARSLANSNDIFDTVRGASVRLISESSGAEATNSNTLASFTSTGFTLGTDSEVNASSYTYVGWQWQAGQGSTSSNTSGTITSTVSANTTAGFSIATFTTSSSGTFTVGHGLGVAPSMIIAKARTSGGTDWVVYHSALGNTKYLALNSTSAVGTLSIWNNTSPTSTVFSGNTTYLGASYPYVAYCWAEIAGFSKFGSYTGNGSTDGPFIYLGFRPKFVMIKCSTSSSNGVWVIKDTSRNTYNVANCNLYADQSLAEDTTSTVDIDLLSNGFKLRGTYSGVNAAQTYIYAAFAENPFKNANAR